ncbi:protein-L-isoaspartate O-methyltransferase [Dacryopinax primogenitus]|uniref:protein-L-isoaspartate(D-aspartate) O-methyltransferase n=1 Tax=Dacryopinax primogenitus (strain DJM 731) TaxID=1858805 RepID=M5GDJ8_DACPD|nr:protein-L-isoaspartate O-methyltransferase [Dacryopinax primogenitus]EJU02468.1 protein-L-isoaspartate O-methyltransferase [Dacryopinax primogenitus]
MAWMCSGRTNKELVQRMIDSKLIKSERVAAAMKATDRASYVRYKEDAYVDSPQSIGYAATISAPHMHAHAAENLLPLLFPGAKVLDVGSGSGYTAAIFHRLVSSEGKKGLVVGVEHISELTDWSVENLKRDGLAKAVEDGEIVMFAGDGRKGDPERGPFNAIHVGAASPELPQVLVDQLAKPGRMFIPVGTNEQAIIQVDKDEQGAVTMKELFGVMYVPLTDKTKQWR